MYGLFIEVDKLGCFQGMEGKKRGKDEDDVYANGGEASSLGMHIKRSRSGRWRTRDSLGRSLRASCTTPIHSHERVNCRRDVDLRPGSYDPPRWDNERCSKATVESSRVAYITRPRLVQPRPICFTKGEGSYLWCFSASFPYPSLCNLSNVTRFTQLVRAASLYPSHRQDDEDKNE